MPSTRTKTLGTLRPYYEAGRAVVSAALGVVPAAVTVDPADTRIGLGGCRVDVRHTLALHDRLVVSHAANLAMQRANLHVQGIAPDANGCDAVLIEGVAQRARAIFEQLWPLIDHIAHRLAAEQTIAGAEIVAGLRELGWR